MGSELKTRYRWIHFEKVDEWYWWCANNKSGDILARVEWYHPWKQWIMACTGDSVVFSHDCLTDIADFLRQLNEADTK